MRATALALLLLAAPLTVAAQPVALVNETKGAVSPASVEPFTELEDGQTVTLGADGEITFSHYELCQAITVRSGELTVTELEFNVAGGRVVAREEGGSCPTDVAAVAGSDSQAAATTLRALPQDEDAEVTFTLIGRREAAAEAEVLRGTTRIAAWRRGDQTPGPVTQVKELNDEGARYTVVVRGEGGRELFRETLDQRQLSSNNLIRLN